MFTTHYPARNGLITLALTSQCQDEWASCKHSLFREQAISLADLSRQWSGIQESSWRL